jgi:hypothetical protein
MIVFSKSQKNLKDKVIIYPRSNDLNFISKSFCLYNLYAKLLKTRKYNQKEKHVFGQHFRGRFCTAFLLPKVLFSKFLKADS